MNDQHFFGPSTSPLASLCRLSWPGVVLPYAAACNHHNGCMCTDQAEKSHSSFPITWIWYAILNYCLWRLSGSGIPGLRYQSLQPKEWRIDFRIILLICRFVALSGCCQEDIPNCNIKAAQSDLWCFCRRSWCPWVLVIWNVALVHLITLSIVQLSREKHY